MKAKRQKVYSFTDALYKSALVVVIGGDRNKYLKEKIGVTDEFLAVTRDWVCEGIYFRIQKKDNTRGNNCSLIWLKTAKIPQLVHELVHFCHSVLAQAGVAVTPNEDEAFAYLIEMWTKTISDRMKAR